jgi:hypothetical protein
MREGMARRSGALAMPDLTTDVHRHSHNQHLKPNNTNSRITPFHSSHIRFINPSDLNAA